MTYPYHKGHPDICSGLPHPIATVSVHWCPHRQAWTVSRTEGPAEQPLALETIDLGPFADINDVTQLATRALSQAIARIEARR